MGSYGTFVISPSRFPYLQQQNYSLAALAKRDAQEDPFAKVQDPAGTTPRSLSEDEMELLYGAELRKDFAA
jgi:phage portal protein BeeE